MKKSVVPAIFTASILSLSFSNTLHAADGNYVEEGRFGVEGLISSNGFQVGLVREADQYEVALDIDGSTSSSGGLSTGDIGIETRVGKRFNIGTFNYISLGADAQTSLFQVANGVSTPAGYTVGPYVGLQRHFSGTSLMLQLYVMPYGFSYTPATGDAPSTSTHQFFQQGGFGIAYLF